MFKNNKKSKKNGKGLSDKFKIEALEPRLMMDAAHSDSDWRTELNDIDISRCRG